MNIKLKLIEEKEDELWFDIVDEDSHEKVGYLFTVGEHIAYEVEEKYRGKGIATICLKEITKRFKNPVLEITYDNLASQRVAQKAGYVLVRENPLLQFYAYPKSKKSHR